MAQNSKLFLQEAFLNMAAFMIYIFSQQIVLLPVMAKLLDSDSYANLILYITIMNVFCNVFGGQLGVTHQLQKKIYVDNETDEHRDFTALMLGASLLIVFCFPLVLYILKFDIASVLFITMTTLLSNFRLYIRYYFRINGKYNYMIFQNICYLAGIAIGIGLYVWLEAIWLPLLIAELMGLIYTFFVVPMKMAKPRKTESLNETLKRYSGLGSADALTNTITLIDKLLIYPLMGSHSLAVYNSGAATSKVAALVVNPLNEVILVKLSKSKDGGQSKLLKTAIWVSLVASALIFVVLIPVIYVLSFVLYRQYLSEINSIIFFLSLSCSFGFTSSILKSFILRYAKSIWITICYIINVALLAVFGVIGANCFGLIGFAAAVALTRVELWLSFVFVLYICIKEETYEK